jgi:hypothetical protein
MKLFQRRKEDFVCGHCGSQITGSGYTNHCSNCLWSKHVDINPGDRKAGCQGLMEPVSIEQKNGEFVILHRCVKCKFERKNKSSPTDNYDLIIELSQQ